MGIKAILDIQVHAVNEIIYFFSQLAVKYQAFRLENGDISRFTYYSFRDNLGQYMGGAHQLATIILLALTVLYIWLLMPKVGGWYAVKVGNLKARLGIEKKVWVFDPSTNRERPVAIPKGLSMYSSVREARSSRAFEDISKLTDFERESAPSTAGLLFGSYSVGVKIGQFFEFYLIFFAIYYFCVGDASWLHNIHG